MMFIYFRGSALQRRLNEREKEMEADERDRMKEREELEEIRKRLLEEGHPDPEAEMERVCVSISVYQNTFLLEVCFKLESLVIF